MLDEIKNIKDTPKNLRSFGLILGGILAVLAVLSWRKGKSSCPYLFIAAALFLAAGVLNPVILKPVYKTWMTAAMAIGWLITQVILTILFYALLTPLGCLNRLMGKSILSSKTGDPSTYWIPRTAQKTKTDYENQF